MDTFFKQKTAIITGGSSGIGLATAIGLARRGANVWLVARNPDRLSNALDCLKEARVNQEQCFGFTPLDVADNRAVESGFADIIHRIGVPDLLVNSAGFSHPGYFEKLDLDVFRVTMDINYFGTIYSIRAVLPGMSEQHSGHIVNISSGAGLVSAFGFIPYSATKFAIRGLSDALRAELKPHGIKVSVVFPVDTDTPQLAYEKQFLPIEAVAMEHAFGLTKPMPASAVADSILQGVSRNRYFILPGFDAKVIYYLARILGTRQYAFLDMLMKIGLRQLKSNRRD
jgi:3-dehydrosphinganine reductase